MHPSQHTNQWVAGPSTHNKIYASSLQETDALFHLYEHLSSVPNNDEGLTRLRKIASIVKPIMRKRGWQVRMLTEFLPENPNLLGKYDSVPTMTSAYQYRPQCQPRI